MSIVDRDSLEASPLADLHAIASELAIDGYRRLRRADLIAAILEKQGGDADAAEAPAVAAGVQEQDEDETPDQEAGGAERSASRRRRGRRGGRGRGAARAGDGDEDSAAAAADEDSTGTAADEDSTGTAADEDSTGTAADEHSTGTAADEDGTGTAADEDTTAAAPEADQEESRREEPSEAMVEGVVELLAGGSGFVRVDPPEPSDDDVYISSAQVKRCELVSGDRVTGPRRAPRRSERFASLIRIETINGRPAAELADSTRFEDLTAAFPSERLKIGSEDPTLKAIEWLTPFGFGSRVTIVGPSRSGKSQALRRLASALADRDELTLTVVLSGVRPEEISEWNGGPVTPTAATSFAASEDAQSGAIEPAVDQARRLAARGANAVVLIDTLDGLAPSTARKALAAARNIVDGGSVTVIATASQPLGGETTVIALDLELASTGRFPALDIRASGALRPELLVGEAGAEAIARTRVQALEPDNDA